jgi:hypothetical protein
MTEAVQDQATEQATTEQQAQPALPDVELPMQLFVSEINYIMAVLGRQPHDDVHGLIAKIKGQGDAALAQALNAAQG